MKEKKPINPMVLILITILILLAILVIFIMPNLSSQKEDKVGVEELFSSSVSTKSASDESATSNFQTQANVEIDNSTAIEDTESESVDDTEEILDEYSSMDDLWNEDEDEYNLKYPIQLYNCQPIYDDASELNDMTSLEFAMLTADDWKHQIPYFHEYLGINTDVYLCYYKTDIFDDWRRESYYYYTTDVNRANARLNLEVDANYIKDNWGLIAIKFDEIESKIYFKLINYENDKILHSTDDWIEY